LGLFQKKKKEKPLKLWLIKAVVPPNFEIPTQVIINSGLLSIFNATKSFFLIPREEAQFA